MSKKSYQNEAQNKVIVLGLIIQFLRLYQSEKILLLGNLLEKLEAILLTEKWLTENDRLTKLDINGYQPIESKPRNCIKRKSDGVTFFFEERIE